MTKPCCELFWREVSKAESTMRSRLKFSSGIAQILTITSASFNLAIVAFADFASPTVGVGNDDATTEAAATASGRTCLAAQFMPATDPRS